MVKIIFSSRYKASLRIQIKGTMARFRCIQDGCIDWIIKGEAVLIDIRVTNIDLAEKNICIALRCLHHAKDTAGNTKRRVVRGTGEAIWCRMFRIVVSVAENWKAAST